MKIGFSCPGFIQQHTPSALFEVVKVASANFTEVFNLQRQTLAIE
jgi:hypothetical protein